MFADLEYLVSVKADVALSLLLLLMLLLLVFFYGNWYSFLLVCSFEIINFDLRQQQNVEHMQLSLIRHRQYCLRPLVHTQTLINKMNCTCIDWHVTLAQAAIGPKWCISRVFQSSSESERSKYTKRVKERLFIFYFYYFFDQTIQNNMSKRANFRRVLFFKRTNILMIHWQ